MTEQTTDGGRNADRGGLTAEEKIGSLFQPDSLLSAQYFETLRRKTILEPEKRLMLAILEDGINCFQENLLAQNVGKSRLFQDAEEWIIQSDGNWVFSFENVCEALGINPAYVRQGLLRWKESKLSKHSKVPFTDRKKMTG